MHTFGCLNCIRVLHYVQIRTSKQRENEKGTREFLGKSVNSHQSRCTKPVLQQWTISIKSQQQQHQVTYFCTIISNIQNPTQPKNSKTHLGNLIHRQILQRKPKKNRILEFLQLPKPWKIFSWGVRFSVKKKRNKRMSFWGSLTCWEKGL